MKKAENKLIIYGVLNWGLGHATRSVPVIQSVLQQGYKVLIASDGEALDYLKKKFPACEFHKLPAYNITYAPIASQLMIIGAQLPKIWSKIRAEHKLLRALVKKHKPIGIISDNRLGFYHKDVKSVYITHQLRLIMPLASGLISKLHHRYINKYDECWVPDVKEDGGLTGDLAHRNIPKTLVRYIGPLSALEGKSSKEVTEKEFDLGVILSGPEPQRTLLERKLIHQLSELDYKVLLIRGTRKPITEAVGTEITVKDFVDADGVLNAIESSKMIISRSGYTSIMDYSFLGNKALLIPTPGQAEQEYLARYQLHKGRFAYANQERLNLKEDLKKAQHYSGIETPFTRQKSWGSLLGLFEGERES